MTIVIYINKRNTEKYKMKYTNDELMELVDKYYLIKYKSDDVYDKPNDSSINDTLRIIIHIFEELLDISHITINLLEKVLNHIQFNKDLTIEFLCSRPYLFLNETHQILSLVQYENIVEHFELYNDENVMKNMYIAFIYDKFLGQNTKNQNFFFYKYENDSFDNKSYKKSLKYHYEKYILCKKQKGYKMYDWKQFQNNFLITISHVVRDTEKYEYWTTKKFIEINNNAHYDMCDLEDFSQSYDHDKIDIEIDRYIKIEGNAFTFEKMQREAIHTFFTTRVMCLCGYPGSGKTTVTKAIIYINKVLGCNDNYGTIILTPTGKALKNIQVKVDFSDNDAFETDNSFMQFATTHRMFYYIYKAFNKYTNDYDEFTKALSRTTEDLFLIRSLTTSKIEEFDKFDLLEKELSSNQPLLLAAKYRINNEFNPFKLIVVDETSMIGLEMFYKIIQCAHENDSKILFIGDNSQLPPIDPGKPFWCLYNMIDTKKREDNEYIIGKHVFLNSIKRSDTKIVEYVKEIYDKKSLKTNKIGKDNDITFIEFNNFDIKNKNNFESTVLKVLKDRNLIVGKNCSILTAQNGDRIDYQYLGGKKHINKFIQEFYQSKTENKSIDSYSKLFCENDRIIRTKNKYIGNILKINGDTGYISRIWNKNNNKNDEVMVDICYDDLTKETIPETTVFRDFELSYAMTVHKKQGDEDDNIIIIISPNHVSWNPKISDTSVNLIYTAISRARKKVIIIGCKKTYNNIYQTVKRRPYFSTFLEFEGNSQVHK